MLQNAYFLAKIGADAAENEQHLPKFCQKLATFAAKWQKFAAVVRPELPQDEEALAQRLLVLPEQVQGLGRCPPQDEIVHLH